MVSYSKVSSDCEIIDSVLEKYKSSINLIGEDQWSGSSKKNLVEKSNQFLNDFKGTINSQMNSFSGALKKLETYKELKKNKENLTSQMTSNSDETTLSLLNTKISIIDSQIKSLYNEIEQLLSSIITSVKSGESISNFADTTGLLGIISTVGEAAKIPKKERMNYLFPNGIPTSKSEMSKYITTVTVKAYDENGKSRDLKISVHKKLANEVKAIYSELYQIGFPVKDSGGYNWRKMVKSSKLSHHSYGVAIDLNVDANPFQGNPDKNSKLYNNETVVAIWKKHGFYWGGDWNSRNDPMHFTYTGY